MSSSVSLVPSKKNGEALGFPGQEEFLTKGFAALGNSDTSPLNQEVLGDRAEAVREAFIYVWL